MWKKELTMRSTLSKIAVILVVIILSSCEKIIQVDLNDAPTQFVIEGVISDAREPQFIKLSRSVSFTETNSFPAVQGAIVKVTDNLGNAMIFTETQPGSYTNTFRGRPGRTYNLSVEANGKTYTAISTMPQPVPLDSVTVREFTFGAEVSRQLQANFKDPVNVFNYYRFVLFLNGKQIKSVYTDNDRFTNGNNVRSLLFHDDDTDGKIVSGDTATVQMQCIDSHVFTYWYTLAEQSRNGPGGGTAPGNPPSNISNVALGYFSAQTQSVKSLKVN
jgi:hypothetical protein